MRRTRAFLVVCAVAALLAIGALVGAHWIRSPAQQAADSRAPARTVLTAKVVRKVLSSVVTMRGSFTQGAPITFTPAGVANVGGSPPSALVLTKVLARAGDSIRAGQVMVEVDGRPVFALPGAFPAYRDLTVGDVGPDVRQLQQALHTVGYQVWDTAGTFGASTEAAARLLYERIGYPPPQTAAAEGASKDGKAQAASAPHVVVPMSEAMFLPVLPARLTRLGGGVGSTVRDPLLSLVSGGITLTGHLDGSSADLVRRGMAVHIVSEATGFTATGTVLSIGTKANSAGQLPVIIENRNTAAGWPQSELGDDVRVVITTAQTRTAALAVPVSAIATSADGKSRVTVIRGGRQHAVTVQPGASVEGYVEITDPRHQLQVGDAVVTGQ